MCSKKLCSGNDGLLGDKVDYFYTPKPTSWENEDFSHENLSHERFWGTIFKSQNIH